MKKIDIYLTGVGGQGIGLLSEVIIRACDYGGHTVRGVDTHGLAQRGGTVISHIRVGEGVHSALIQEGSAELLIALERNEALRGLNSHLKDRGTLIYYNATWQSLPVRLNKAKEVDEKVISEECVRRNIREIKVFNDKLENPRMQNVVLLSEIAKEELIPSVKKEHYEMALRDLLDGRVLEKNLEIFNS